MFLLFSCDDRFREEVHWVSRFALFRIKLTALLLFRQTKPNLLCADMSVKHRLACCYALTSLARKKNKSAGINEK